MRIWHKDLIPYLPRQQLIGQWRECCLIAKQITEKGTPNHVLVNRVMGYPKDHFYTFCKLITCEMTRRGYRMTMNAQRKVWRELWNYEENLFPGWHNDRYLKQCLANLQEKADCGAIPAEEWKRITDRWPGWK